MWGNPLGWFLSLLIIAGAVTGLVYLERLDRVTAPTSLSNDARNLAPLDLPPEASLKGLMPDLTGPADPAPLYSAAIDAYWADPDVYDKVAHGENPPKQFEQLPAIAPLFEAALSPNEAVLAPMAEEVVTLSTPPRPLEAIGTLGEAIVRAGLALEETNPVAATGYYNVALALGTKLYNERLVYRELAVGTTLMSEAALRLAKLSRGQERAAGFDRFERARWKFVTERVTPLHAVFSSVDPPTVARHAGDVFVFARSSKERVWRVEAIFALARYRFSAPRPRDRAAAARSLEALAADEKDPIVRRAATLARDLTVEENRTLR
jgi:hypothetical protein